MRAARGAVVAALLLVSACSSDSGGDPSRPAPSERTPTGVAGPSTPPPTASSSVITSSSARSAKRSRTKPVPTTPVRTVTVDGEHDSYVIQVWAELKNDSCYDHAYGEPVITYLTTHPCRGLGRVLATTVVDGHDVGLARSSFSFSGAAPAVYRTTTRFRALVERDGTGSVADLFRDGYRLPSGPTAVPSPDAFSARAQDSAITIVDAWYLDGPTPPNDPTLEQMAKDLFRRF